MSIRPRHLAIGAAGVAVVGLVAGGAVWAVADDNDVVRNGTCTTANYEFEVEAEENDTVELNLELLAASVGEEWSVSLSQDGQLLYSGVRIADDEAEIDVDIDAAAKKSATYVAEFGPVGTRQCRVELTH
ncbi:hypothetical protein ACLM5J_19445 [Nocardioides sp. Bht2]|uniref:hypothetical protein n=1 Tax=Nocardioides sp. Bht2 TaxID=3392297 RepID=UPI0039B3C5D8